MPVITIFEIDADNHRTLNEMLIIIRLDGQRLVSTRPYLGVPTNTSLENNANYYWT